MENNSTYQYELITKYLAGEITEEETLVLKGWLQSDSRNQKLFEECRNTWLAIEYSKIDSTVVSDEEWNKLESKIKGGQADRWTSGRADERTGGQADERTGGQADKPAGFFSLPLYNKITTNSGFHWAFRIAAVFILIVIPTFLLFRNFNDPTKKVITAQNQILDTHLPDGTSVSLNRGSTIEFSENFKGTRREVKLTGEACFAVKHDDKSKFVIINGNVRIEDIGTTFYVNTNKSVGQMEVILSEGKASVYFKDNPSGKVDITPGDRVDIWLTGSTIKKSVNDDENYLAWKTKRLVFSNNTMSDVVTLLNKVYHSDIRLSGSDINNCRLTAIFDNQSLESVFNVIKSTLDVAIIPKGSAFEISGNKCDL